MSEVLKFPLWIVIREAEDMPGVWVSHCLEFNVVSQGDSPKQAFEMIREATSMVVVDDLAKGFDLNNRRAPKTYFDELSEIRSRAKLVPLEEALASTGHALLAIPVLLTVSLRPSKKPGRRKKTEVSLPKNAEPSWENNAVTFQNGECSKRGLVGASR